MKNKIIFTGFLFLLALLLTSLILPNMQEDKGSGGRGKIISETDKEDMEDHHYYQGVIFIRDIVTGGYYKTELKYKFRFREAPCWFDPGTNEVGDWILFRYIEPTVVAGDSVNVEIIGFEKAIENYGIPCRED